MKSKAHHKKCTELGIVPVPTTVDEANIDEDSLARQETLKKMKMVAGENEVDSDLDDDLDDDEDDDEEDDEIEEEEEEMEEDPPQQPVGQFEDVATVAEPAARGEREQEVARSLLDLGVMAPAGCKPTTYPYASHFHPEETPPPVPEMKEEPPQPAPSPVSKPMDLSTSVVEASDLLASIYSPIVSETAARRALSPSESSVVPATSGMLQAYLTEKALKEGLMKRQQVKVTEHPVVTFFPAQSRSRSEFVVPLSSSSAVPTSSSAAYKLTDDGKTACSICNKVFTKPSQLRLHINIHYFERPFRCEACAVSFRTKGHLQKHKRSVTHFNKVNMNLTFGTPSTENPRPFKCSDCMIAFRIHGHLAKHLRSKMHIMKLECLGKLPFGTYAEMERSGINLNEIDTTDCLNSLESLQSLAHRLYKQDPSKIQQWQQEVLSFFYNFHLQMFIVFLFRLKRRNRENGPSADRLKNFRMWRMTATNCWMKTAKIVTVSRMRLTKLLLLREKRKRRFHRILLPVWRLLHRWKRGDPQCTARLAESLALRWKRSNCTSWKNIDPRRHRLPGRQSSLLLPSSNLPPKWRLQTLEGI